MKAFKSDALGANKECTLFFSFSQLTNTDWSSKTRYDSCYL